MPRNACPVCSEHIEADDINIEQGVALCRGCGKLSRLADVVAEATPANPQLAADPPPGCRWYQDGAATVIVASARSIAGAVAILAFALFWNSIVSVFVLVAVSGLYVNLVGPLPAWLPAPPMNNQSSGGLPLGMTLFLCVFLIPFVVIGGGALLLAVFALAGRVEVRLLGDEGEVRNAIGPFSWKRRFHASEVRRISLGQTTYKQNGEHRPVIRLEADRTIDFGSALSQPRRDWLIAVLHHLLVAGPATSRAVRLG